MTTVAGEGLAEDREVDAGAREAQVRAGRAGRGDRGAGADGEGLVDRRRRSC